MNMASQSAGVIVSIGALFALTSFLPVQAAQIRSVDAEATTVSVGVGNIKDVITPTPIQDDGRRFSLFGYTSPHARVVIQNPGLHNEESADEKGYFIFRYLFVALFREDICIVAYDTNSVSTPPLCVPPPLGDDNAGRSIGPVLLPPSAQISSGNAYVGDSVTFVGQTVPDAEVKLSMFTDEMQAGKKISLIPSAYAYTIPQLQLSSNKKGEYSLTLPTASSQFLRMFTRSIFEGNSSPKSTTLVLDIFPVWMLLFRFLGNIFSLLKNRLLEIILLLQMYGLLMYFLKKYFAAHAIKQYRRRALALRHNELLLLQHEINKPRIIALALRSYPLLRLGK